MMLHRLMLRKGCEYRGSDGVQPLMLVSPNTGKLDLVNPCGVGVGKDAHFRIQVLPNDYPDEKIVWSNETAGVVDFVGGNTGWVLTTASGGRV